MSDSNTILPIDYKEYDKTRQVMFWSIIRATPIIVPSAAIVASILDYKYVPFLVGTGITYIINQTLKYSLQYLYSIPVLSNILTSTIGPGTRPEGACNSSSFLKWPAKPARTFGMPSGHSQTAWYLAGFVFGHLYIKYADTRQLSYWSSIHMFIGTAFVTVFAALVSYSRVYIDKVHTIQQVIIGGIIGLITGLVCVPPPN
jgi:membrane-associated phospholipid phosphatase